jgi:alkylhydroperoxidase family enzyme
MEDKMATLDWNEYRKQILSRVGEIEKLSPETVKGYAALGGAGAKTGHLDAKTRELIALAVAISLRCDGCITVRQQRSSAPPRKKSPRRWVSGSASTPALRLSTLLARLTRSMWPLETLAAKTVVLH